MKKVGFEWDKEKDKENQVKHNVSFATSMVRDIGGKEGRYMKSKIKYADEPMGKIRVIKDFLPPPDQLVLKEENVKVTIALKKSSVDFFKKEAQRYHTSYQKMIRRLIDLYASKHEKSA